ncbi:hypothetical protein ACFX13_039508 [Malus domestica]
MASSKLKALYFLHSRASEERFYSCTYRGHSRRENGAAENHGRNMRHSSDKRPAERIQETNMFKFPAMGEASRRRIC